MAYEVTKLVNGRPYRYSVRSERDPASGKTRNRWTYLGRIDANRPPAAAKPRRNAREALLDALERLLDRSDVGDVTAAAVSIEAGLAHGTFYRYFKNRVDAIRALTDRLREAKTFGMSMLDEPPADVAGARSALRSWTRTLLHARIQHHGLVRAWYVLAVSDEEIRTAIRERRTASARKLEAWLGDVAARGLVQLPDPTSTAAVLFTMLDGIGREALSSGEPLDDLRAGATVDLVERAVFGALG